MQWSVPWSIRPRVEEDVEACAALLHKVHVADRYPVNWPPIPGPG